MHIRAQYIVRIYEENAEKRAFSTRLVSVLVRKMLLECGKKCPRNGAHTFGIDFQKLSVVGQKTVGFVLDIADLRENGGAKSSLDHGNDLILIETFERLRKRFFIIEEAVAVGVAEIEGMPRDLVGIAAEFRKNERAFASLQIELFEINVFALDIALRFFKPAGCGIKNIVGVHGFVFFVKAVGIILSPSLVEDRIIAYAGMIVK